MRRRIQFRYKLIASLVLGLAPAVAAFLYQGTVKRSDLKPRPADDAWVRHLTDPIGSFVTVVAYVKDTEGDSYRLIPSTFGLDSDLKAELTGDAEDEFFVTSDLAVLDAQKAQQQRILVMPEVAWGAFQLLPTERRASAASPSTGFTQGLGLAGGAVRTAANNAATGAGSGAVVALASAAKVLQESLWVSSALSATQQEERHNAVSGSGAGLSQPRPGALASTASGSIPVSLLSGKPGLSAAITTSAPITLASAKLTAASNGDFGSSASSSTASFSSSASTGLAPAASPAALPAAAPTATAGPGLTVLSELMRASWGQTTAPFLSPRDLLELAALSVATPVPEPGAWALLTMGLAAMAAAAKAFGASRH